MRDTHILYRSHGLSVGSLGKSAGSTDLVQNVVVNGANMVDSTKAVGIKLYQGTMHVIESMHSSLT